MAIPDTYRANFDTLARAFENGDLALLEVTESATGAPAYLLTAVQRGEDEFEFVPLARMLDDDPYETFDPPAIR